MNRLTLSALGLAGVLALVAQPAAAQHRREGEERGGNGGSRGQAQQGEQRQQGGEPRQQSGQRQQSEHAQPRQESRQQSQPAQAPPPPPSVAPGAVPRQDVEHAVPRQGYNGRYDNRRYGYAAPRYVGPRYYSGYYNGPRYVGPRFTVAPRRFYRPYYVFNPRISIGFGIWAGYPVTYYDPYYYPYDYYPYYSTPGYVPPAITVQPDQANMGGLSFSITPDTAEVWVDGNYFGAVGDYGPESQPLGLPAGRHHIELREPGYQVSSFDVDIVPGQVIPYQGQLEP